MITDDERKRFVIYCYEQAKVEKDLSLQLEKLGGQHRPAIDLMHQRSLAFKTVADYMNTMSWEES